MTLNYKDLIGNYDRGMEQTYNPKEREEHTKEKRRFETKEDFNCSRTS